MLKKYYSDKRYKIKNSFSNIRKKLADKEEENKMERIIKKFPSLKKQGVEGNKASISVSDEYCSGGFTLIDCLW